jgi:hypothetical protein
MVVPSGYRPTRFELKNALLGNSRSRIGRALRKLPSKRRICETLAPMGPRRMSLVILVLTTALSSLAAAHYYLAKRLVLDSGLEGGLVPGLSAAIAVLGVGSILQPALERALPAPWFRIVSWPFLVWMGVFWIGLNVLWIAEGLGAMAGWVGLGPVAPGLRAAALWLLIGALAAWGLRGGLGPPRLERVEHTLPRWPGSLAGLRIVQISDVHIGPILGRRFLEDLVARVNALDADLVAITGDLVDGRVDQLQGDVTPLGELRAKHGVYFVTGNHDAYSGDEAWVAHLETLGIRVLRNRRDRIELAAGSFWLAGVDDHRGDWAAGSSEDLPRALEGWDPSEPLVLLAHDPSTFKRAHRRGIHLQLSGHTHGGQIWPFRWLVRLAVPWIEGCHEAGDSRLYVSRGTGFWGPPMRILSPAEITEHTLRAV